MALETPSKKKVVKNPLLGSLGGRSGDAERNERKEPRDGRRRTDKSFLFLEKGGRKDVRGGRGEGKEEAKEGMWVKLQLAWRFTRPPDPTRRTKVRERIRIVLRS